MSFTWCRKRFISKLKHISSKLCQEFLKGITHVSTEKFELENAQLFELLGPNKSTKNKVVFFNTAVVVSVCSDSVHLLLSFSTGVTYVVSYWWILDISFSELPENAPHESIKTFLLNCRVSIGRIFKWRASLMLWVIDGYWVMLMIQSMWSSILHFLSSNILFHTEICASTKEKMVCEEGLMGKFSGTYIIQQQQNKKLPDPEKVMINGE